MHVHALCLSALFDDRVLRSSRELCRVCLNCSVFACGCMLCLRVWLHALPSRALTPTTYEAAHDKQATTPAQQGVQRQAAQAAEEGGGGSLRREGEMEQGEAGGGSK